MGDKINTEKITNKLVVNEEVTKIISVAMQGERGIKGDSEDAITKITNGPIGGHRGVTIDNTDKAVYADKDNKHKAIGISLNAASDGGTVEIRLAGEIDEISWNWTAGQPIYLGNNGLLTQVTPTSGYLVELGYAITKTKMIVAIKMPIALVYEEE